MSFHRSTSDTVVLSDTAGLTEIHIRGALGWVFSALVNNPAVKE